MRRSLFFLVISAFMLCACQRASIDEIISARDGVDLMMWRSKVADDFTLQEWHDFDGALQELKYQIMTTGEATGSEAIQQALLSHIDGKTVGEVLITGYNFGLARRVEERGQIIYYQKSQRKPDAKDVDGDFARYLENIRRQQDIQIARLDEQIADIKSIMARRGFSFQTVPSQSLEPTARSVMAHH